MSVADELLPYTHSSDTQALSAAAAGCRAFRGAAQCALQPPCSDTPARQLRSEQSVPASHNGPLPDDSTKATRPLLVAAGQ